MSATERNDPAITADCASAPIESFWVCPNCDHDVTTRYCPACGEHALDPKYLTMRGLLAQLAHMLVSLDSKTIRTVRTLVMRPGCLTMAFQQGRRVAFLGPFKIFILANVLFFAVQSSTELRVYSTRLEQQVDAEDGTDLGRALVDRYLAKSGLTLDEYAAVYNRAVSVNARSMIGLMVLPFALCIPLICWRSGRPFSVHVVFSLHFYAFVLLLYCIPATLVAVEGLFGSAALVSRTADNLISVVLLGIRAVYLYLAIKPVYGSRGLLRALQTSALVVAEFGCFLMYRFVLLPITLFTSGG